MERKSKEKMEKKRRDKFVRYSEGAELYHMSQSKFIMILSKKRFLKADRGLNRKGILRLQLSVRTLKRQKNSLLRWRLRFIKRMEN